MTECCWLVHCAAVAGTGWPASSYQLEHEVNKWHFSSGGDQVSGTSSGSVDTVAQPLKKPLALGPSSGSLGEEHLIGPAFSPLAVSKVLPWCYEAHFTEGALGLASAFGILVKLAVVVHLMVRNCLTKKHLIIVMKAKETGLKDQL